MDRPFGVEDGDITVPVRSITYYMRNAVKNS